MNTRAWFVSGLGLLALCSVAQRSPVATYAGQDDRPGSVLSGKRASPPELRLSGGELHPSQRASGDIGSISSSSSEEAAVLDFVSRCRAPGIIKCRGWDDPTEFIPASGGGGYADGLYPASGRDIAQNGASRSNGVVTITTTKLHYYLTGDLVRVSDVADSSFNGSFRVLSAEPATKTFTYRQNGPERVSGGGTTEGFEGTMDTAIKASGGGSLRFSIRPGSSANASGLWLEAFGSNARRTNFGAHSTFYVQWRQRFSPEMLNFNWDSLGSGWKQIIMYSVPGPSCATTQLVMENTYSRNIATAYTECGARGLVTNNGERPFQLEQGDYNCPYGAPYTAPPCFVFKADKWLTFYWKVQIGEWGQPTSYIQAWVGLPGQPLRKFINLPNFVLNQDPGRDFNQIQLTPYMTDKDLNKTNHPTAYTWYDELIISSQPIPAPADNVQTVSHER
jgi:hypothetical protein